jgi:hypothetical protein
MNTAIVDIAPIAVAVAISPLPIIAVILILLSQKARSNGVAFLIGWFLGLAFAELIVLALVSILNFTPRAEPLKAVLWFKLVIGVLLIILSIRQWRQRPRQGQEPTMPGWMRSIDSLTPMRALGLAALLSTGGNLALILAAAAGIARSKLDIGQEAIALSVFIVIGSLTVAAMVGYHVIAGQSAMKALTTWKTWLLKNNATVMSVLLLLVGVLLVGKGLSGLGLFG